MAPLLGPCVVLGSSPFDCCSRPPDPALHARSKVWVLAYCRGRSRNRVSSCTLHAMHALILAPFLLGAPAMEQKEFENPGIVEVRAPGGDLTVRARRGMALLPGLGEVEQVYAYEVRRGTAFPAAPRMRRPAPPRRAREGAPSLGARGRSDRHLEPGPRRCRDSRIPSAPSPGRREGAVRGSGHAWHGAYTTKRELRDLPRQYASTHTFDRACKAGSGGRLQQSKERNRAPHTVQAEAVAQALENFCRRRLSGRGGGQRSGVTVRRTVATRRMRPRSPLMTSGCIDGTSAAPNSTPTADAAPMRTATISITFGMRPMKRSVTAPAATVGTETMRLSVPASLIGTEKKYSNAGIRISPPATPRTPLATAMANATAAASSQRATPLGSASVCSTCAIASYSIQRPTAIRYAQTIHFSGRDGNFPLPNAPRAAPAIETAPITAIRTRSSRVQECWPQRRNTPSSTVNSPMTRLTPPASFSGKPRNCTSTGIRNSPPPTPMRPAAAPVTKPNVTAIAPVRTVSGWIASMSDKRRTCNPGPLAEHTAKPLHEGSAPCERAGREHVDEVVFVHTRVYKPRRACRSKVLHARRACRERRDRK